MSACSGTRSAARRPHQRCSSIPVSTQGADLDGVLFETALANGLSRPFMLMSADPGFADDPNRAAFWSRLRGHHYAVDIKGARHFAFSDLAFFAPQLIQASPSAGQGIRAQVGNIDGAATLAAER